MSSIAPLPAGPLDIVGDIHGEFEALQALLGHLGYDEAGRHPQGRRLVFVGDFCDRGPNSPAVLDSVMQMVENGRAFAVLGNHEINLLREDAKDGAGWFFDAREHSDQAKYAPFQRPNAEQRQRIVAFLAQLPIALERSDLRVVHAAWQGPQIAAVRKLAAGQIRKNYDRWENEAHELARSGDLSRRMTRECAHWHHSFEDPLHPPPFMPAHAENELTKSMLNPLKVLTCGVERRGTEPFYAGGKWRFVERVAWWNDYADTTPVVVGHYWRRVNEQSRETLGKGDSDLFAAIPPTAWHGQQGNVFCVDYSVGGRWSARISGQPAERDFKLAALRWPERDLVFDDGQSMNTTGFAQNNTEQALC